jgi:hypothetical protein
VTIKARYFHELHYYPHRVLVRAPTTISTAILTESRLRVKKNMFDNNRTHLAALIPFNGHTGRRLASSTHQRLSDILGTHLLYPLGFPFLKYIMDTIPFVLCLFSVALFLWDRSQSCSDIKVHTASSVFLYTHMAGPGGLFLSIFWLSNYKESTRRKGNTQQCRTRRAGHICFLLSFAGLFRLSLRDMAVTICHDGLYPRSLGRWQA